MSLFTAVICTAGVGATLYVETNGLTLETINTRPDTFGNYLTSSFAIVFNMSLLSAGFCLMLAMLGVYFTFNDSLNRYIAVTGAIVGLSILLMGVFPINFIDWHRKVSTLYMLSSFSLHLLCIPNFFITKSTISKKVLALSTFGVLCTLSLMLQIDWSVLDFPPCAHADNSICTVSLSMWLLTNVNILWCVSLCLDMRKHIKHQQSVIVQSSYANL
ncbi:hypothetical protein G3R49_01800 [Shewanella sp. WXL01]|uniref:hypothetical protein n=1 Tax=Shewanella sp. WXL01 TaxID=2709721 RepID=UPI001438624B|nr:hypothetical protein [Shewanella sp. WXL01]NKF49313.1 hypothetical protein [Shewanella sp. WXL01]